MRWSIESFVHWGISTLAGLLVRKRGLRAPGRMLTKQLLVMPFHCANAMHMFWFIIAVQGIVGLVRGSSALLCSHVVLGGIATAALTAQDAANFAFLELRFTLCRLLKFQKLCSLTCMHVATPGHPFAT